MDLLSKLDTNVEVNSIIPRDIFMTLPSKAPSYDYPRDVQGQVWEKWFDKRNEKNVIIKMNTGSGKTVVGLTILQSCLNEKKGPSVYVVPDTYLVKQVINEANKLGISVTDNKDAYEYTNSKSILITTVHTIINGRSSFGMRESGNYPIGSIIDDVHACMDKIISQFMIKIDSKTEVYAALVSIFSPFLKEYNPKSYIDVIEMQDSRRNLLIPYWEWQRQQENVYRTLLKYKDDKQISFCLPLLDRSLETCDCIISGSSIEISPKGIDLDKITSFGRANRRIYMSATLSDDSVFISTLGLSKKDMENIITPNNANDIGDRLILFPKHINYDISDNEIKEKVEEISKKYNVVIIVPSFFRAKFWDENKENTATNDNIDQIVSSLKRGEHLGKIVFVNRYDGIDLPGDACRMLVIDGLPPLNSTRDRYIQSIVPESTILLKEQVQRIEQGMGRGVRSNNDRCCIVLMGDELADVLSRNKGIDYFSAATRCQYDLSKKLWDLLVGESESKPNISQIFELANYSLENNTDWISTCKKNLASVKYSEKPSIDEKTVAQREAFEKSLNSQWAEAANIIKAVKDKEKDPKTKGYLCQIQAEYTNKEDCSCSQEILKAGKSLNGAILSPIEGIQYKLRKNTVNQAKAISDKLDKEKLYLNDLIGQIDSLLSKLSMREHFTTFEYALDQIGLFLGFVCSRPDIENTGDGPDNLWALDSNNYLVIECKSDAVTSFISKDYCNQLSGAVNWFTTKYSSSNNFVPIMIHPSIKVHKVAYPNENMRVMNEEKLLDFIKNIREFYRSICRNANYKDISKINELLHLHKLQKDEIVKNYTMAYER